MTIKEILQKTQHRPWDIPKQPWSFYQEWNNVIFLHWEVDYDELSKCIPEGLEIDTFQGKPWVSLVAFDMEKIRPKNFPSFGAISNFHEINLRTYVKVGHKTGVYFLSIEASKRISSMISKTISGLPYRYSSMQRGSQSFNAKNNKFGDSFNIQFNLGKKMLKKSTLDKWLSERYALFQDSQDGINEFEIHHMEWPLSELEIETLRIDYNRYNNLINGQPHKIHYSRGVEVIAWGRNRIS